MKPTRLADTCMYMKPGAVALRSAVHRLCVVARLVGGRVNSNPAHAAEIKVGRSGP